MPELLLDCQVQHIITFLTPASHNSFLLSSRHPYHLHPGITMRAYQRLQVSSQVAGLGATLDPLVSPNTTLPLFWAELSSEITQEAATQFRQRVYG
jgi:hypothetical protein